MNGYSLLSEYKITALADALCKSKPYREDDDLCLDLEYFDANISVVFLNTGQLPDKQSLRYVIQEIATLDKRVALEHKEKSPDHYYDEAGLRCEISYVEVKGATEMTLYYGFTRVNSQWGVQFRRTEANDWERSNFVFA